MYVYLLFVGIILLDWNGQRSNATHLKIQFLWALMFIYMNHIYIMKRRLTLHRVPLLMNFVKYNFDFITVSGNKMYNWTKTKEK